MLPDVDMNSLPLLISCITLWLPGLTAGMLAVHGAGYTLYRSWYIKRDNTVTQLYSPTIHITGHNGK